MKIISQKIAYECPILRVEERHVQIKGTKKTFWVVVRPPNVTIVALTKDKKIILIKEQLKDKEALLLPGGKVEKYHPSLQEIQVQAANELQEEAGYRGKIELLSKDSSPWTTLERDFYHFIAWDCENVGQSLEDGEIISTFLVTEKEVENIINQRKMTSPEEERTLIEALAAFRKKKLL